ncbi:hypothetical protein Ct61P_14581 [Colletotrichum tofieldiae]|nr:hypothetical protein Ct61P_14581 [Colletotrichum tofieldiae]
MEPDHVKEMEHDHASIEDDQATCDGNPEPRPAQAPQPITPQSRQPSSTLTSTFTATANPPSPLSPSSSLLEDSSSRDDESSYLSGSYSAAVAAIEAADSIDPLPIAIRLRNTNLARFQDYIRDIGGVFRFCYDSAAEECYVEIIRYYPNAAVATGNAEAADVKDPVPEANDAALAIAQRIRRVSPIRTTRVKSPGGSIVQPDISFRERKFCYPAFVGEIAYSQTTADVEEKAWEYIKRAVVPSCRVRVVFVIDVTYPYAEKATVSLLAADDRSDEPYWVVHREPFYDESAETPLSGSIDIFASDFLGSLDGVPDELRRLPPVANDDTQRRAYLLSLRATHGQSTITFENLREAFEEALAEARDFNESQAQLVEIQN